MSLQLYKNIKKDIDTQKYLYLSSAYSSNIASSQLQYLNRGFDLYVILQDNSKLAQQVEYSPEVQVVFDSASSAKSKGIKYRGVIEKITDKDENYRYAKKFTRRFRRFKKFFFNRKTTLYRIKPIEIRRIQFGNRFNDNVLEFKENDKNAIQKLLFKGKKIIKSWVKATRISFVLTSLVSVLLGAAVAYSETGNFNQYYFWLTLLGTMLIHLGANMLNDFYDHQTGNDQMNFFHNELTGGSRVIQKGVFSKEKVLITSILLLLSGIGIGLFLNYLVGGFGILIIGFVGLFLAIGYSVPGLKFAYRGMGEIAIGLSFGLVITVGSYFVQAANLSFVPFIAAVPAAIFVFLIIYINEFQDYRADKNSGKKTLVVRISSKYKAMRYYSLLIFLPYVWILPFVVFRLLPIWSLLMMLTLPLSIIAIKKGSVKYRKIYELLIVNKLTITIHFLSTLLLAVGFYLKSLF